MTRDEISLKIRSLIAEQLKKPLDTITEKNTLTELGADSLDNVEIIMKLEEAFKIEIRDEEVHHLTTVGQAIDYIEKKLQ